jgi:hypothetical protein
MFAASSLSATFNQPTAMAQLLLPYLVNGVTAAHSAAQFWKGGRLQDKCSELLAAINLSTPIGLPTSMVRYCTAPRLYLINTVSQALQVCIIAEGVEDETRPAAHHSTAHQHRVRWLHNDHSSHQVHITSNAVIDGGTSPSHHPPP